VCCFQSAPGIVAHAFAELSLNSLGAHTTTAVQVFLYRGRVHILPPNVGRPVDDSDVCRPTLLDALRALVDPAVPSEASPAIQDVIAAKMAGYPERARENLHRARCFVPRGVARLLVACPALVSAAVEAVLVRDAGSFQVRTAVSARGRAGPCLTRHAGQHRGARGAAYRPAAVWSGSRPPAA